MINLDKPSRCFKAALVVMANPHDLHLGLKKESDENAFDSSSKIEEKDLALDCSKLWFIASVLLSFLSFKLEKEGDPLLV